MNTTIKPSCLSLFGSSISKAANSLGRTVQFGAREVKNITTKAALGAVISTACMTCIIGTIVTTHTQREATISAVTEDSSVENIARLRAANAAYQNARNNLGNYLTSLPSSFLSSARGLMSEVAENTRMHFAAPQFHPDRAVTAPQLPPLLLPSTEPNLAS